MKPKIGALITGAIAVAVIAGLSLFVVDQRQNAIVFQLGEVKEVVTAPGLHFKWPLIQNVRYFNMQIQTYDDAEPLRFITSEKKNVLVDYFVKWRITNVRLFYVSFAGDEARALAEQAVGEGEVRHLCHRRRQRGFTREIGRFLGGPEHEGG